MIYSILSRKNLQVSNLSALEDDMIQILLIQISSLSGENKLLMFKIFIMNTGSN